MRRENSSASPIAPAGQLQAAPASGKRVTNLPAIHMTMGQLSFFFEGVLTVKLYRSTALPNISTDSGSDGRVFCTL